MSSNSNKISPPAVADKTPFVYYQTLVFLILAVGALLAVTGCRSNFDPTPASASTPPTAPYYPEFDSHPASAPPIAAYNPGMENYSTNMLHEGDVVRITFQYSTNFDAVEKVALDGTLNLNMVGRVMAAGRTVTELQQDLTQDYQPYAKGDIITVDMVSSGAIVYVCGAVMRPGDLEMDHPLTVLEAVMGSEGFDNTRAKLSDVTVLRIVNGRQQAYRINLNRVLAGRDKTPFYLQPYDIVYVPAKVFNY